MRKLIAFGWYGGKYSHLDWLLPLLPQTTHYCDAPYPHDSRGDANAYANEMTDAQHQALAEVLRRVKGKVAVSGYHSQLMDELYGDWQRIEAPEKICYSVKTPRTEVLWVNYKIGEHVQCQPTVRLHPAISASILSAAS